MAAHNLPQYTTPFIGRDAEIADLGERLKDPTCRLLTLVGPGGIGKTRLAIEAASRQLASYADGIYFVPLQAVTSIENIVPTMANAIYFDFPSDNDPKSQLFDHLQDKRLLLILDNLEHLLAAADMTIELLGSAPQCKLLVTSREALNLRDEWLYQVEGLPYPKRELSSAIETYDAVNLFVHHAGRRRRDFSLDEDREAVIRVCQLVQGMPLGIELATTWLRRLPCVEIARELQRSLDILKTDLRDVPERHRSMRAVFDHSWKLLSEEERKVFMGLSVFRGGFRRDAAERVVSASLPILMSLVDKSLLKVNSEGRYEIHELQRQFAEERLEAMPERKVWVRNQHSAYYTAFMDRPVSDYIGTGNREILRAVDAEIDNVRAAWDWAVEDRQVSNLTRALQGLYWYAWLRSWREEGERVFHRVVAVFRAVKPTDEAQIALGRALSLQANMDIWLGQSARARERAQESVGILRSLNARQDLARALGALGWATLDQRDVVAAKAPLEEAVALNEETGRYEIQAFTMGQLAYIAQLEGDQAACEHWHQQALLLGRRIGDQRTISHELCSLGKFARQQGQYVRARRLFEESLSVARAAEIDPLTINALHQLGMLAQMTAGLDVARGHAEESLRIARNYSQRPFVAWSLIYFADVQVAQGECETARQHYQEVLALGSVTANPVYRAAVLTGLGHVALCHGDYDEAQHNYVASLALCREIGDKHALVSNIVSLAKAMLAQDVGERARPYLLEALQIAEPLGWRPTILDVVVSIAESYVQQSDLAEAVQLAMLVSDHPASPAEAKARAQRIVARPEVEQIVGNLASTRRLNPDEDLDTVVARLMQHLTALVDQPLVEPLSERELEVLRLVASGMTNEAIAAHLVLATGTVKRHVHNINAKLDTRNRTQAVKRAQYLALL